MHQTYYIRARFPFNNNTLMFAGLTFSVCAFIYTIMILNDFKTVTFTFTGTNVHAHTWKLMDEHIVRITWLNDSSTEAQCRRTRKQHTYT